MQDPISPADIQSLAAEACAARELAYCPYSEFRVGCAVLTASGRIIAGANVENASYGAGICAERCAISRAIMEGERRFTAIAISSDQEDPISPCGICRQFIREFAVDIPIYMCSADSRTVVSLTLAELLPMSFGPENLGKHTSV